MKLKLSGHFLSSPNQAYAVKDGQLHTKDGQRERSSRLSGAEVQVGAEQSEVGEKKFEGLRLHSEKTDG